jgi:hypothetical protein
VIDQPPASGAGINGRSNLFLTEAVESTEVIESTKFTTKLATKFLKL